MKISLALKFCHEVGLAIRKQWCRNQQESFINLDTRNNNSRCLKNQLSDDNILIRIGSRFSTKNVLKHPKPLPVSEKIVSARKMCPEDIFS